VGRSPRRELDEKMDSNLSGSVTQLPGLTRFLPASLVFVLIHVLFVGGAIFLASMN
jgi:hypothetical protein